MSDVPVQLIVAAFQEEKAAKEALATLKEAKNAGLIKIENAAVLRKDARASCTSKRPRIWVAAKALHLAALPVRLSG